MYQKRKMIDIDELYLANLAGDILLENFCLTLSTNCRIGITGPSGCGKTTLMKSIINQKINQFSKCKKFEITDDYIGYVPQSDGLLPWFSLRQNFDIVNRNNTSTSDYDSLLIKFGLSHCINKYPREMSGGEYQRSLLALAIILNPPLYLVDEPLTQVDLKIKWEILEYWSNFIKDRESSVLLISHDIETLLYMCDTIIIISGKPASCQKIITIDYPHPRITTLAEFNNQREKIINQIKKN